MTLLWCNGIPYIHCLLELGIHVSSVYVHSVMWILFGVKIFHISIVNWSVGEMYPKCMCILLHVKLIWCNGIPLIYWQLEWGYMYPHYICVFWYMCHLCGVMVFSISIVNWSGGTSIFSICAFCYMWNLFGVMVFPRSIVNWSEGLHVSSIYVHSAICETYFVLWYSIDLLSIGVGGRCMLSICASCYMSNLFGVTVFHRSIVNWSVWLVVSSVYMHSDICETYLV